jgi:hypothetical protein
LLIVLYFDKNVKFEHKMNDINNEPMKWLSAFIEKEGEQREEVRRRAMLTVDDLMKSNGAELLEACLKIQNQHEKDYDEHQMMMMMMMKDNNRLVMLEMKLEELGLNAKALCEPRDRLGVLELVLDLQTIAMQKAVEDEDEADDDDVFGMRDGDALNEIDDDGFYAHLGATETEANANDENYDDDEREENATANDKPAMSPPVKFINAARLLDNDLSFETSPPFKHYNTSIALTNDFENKMNVNPFEDEREFQRIERSAPSFISWNILSNEKMEENNNSPLTTTVISHGRHKTEDLVWFSPLNPENEDDAKLDKLNLSVAEIALLRRGKALSSSSSSPYFTTLNKSEKQQRQIAATTTATTRATTTTATRNQVKSQSPLPPLLALKSNASEIKIAIKFSALAGESLQIKHWRNESLIALESEQNFARVKNQFVILFSETSPNAKIYKGLYRITTNENNTITLRKIHGVSKNTLNEFTTSRIAKAYKYNLGNKMWNELLITGRSKLDANVMAVTLKPKITKSSA